MKLITAIIKPHKLEDVRKAISGEFTDGLTVTEIRGYGRQQGHSEIYRGAEFAVNFLPKLKIEAAVPNNRAEATVIAIREAAFTGQIGDGKIFTTSLEKVVRIRTGEVDLEAL